MLHALMHSADDLFNSEGAWWILALDGILLIPLIFAVFFYPLMVLGGVAAAVILTVALLGLMRVIQARRHHP
jgi:hypothetical protein